MNATIRTILLTGLFLFGLITGLKAQEKYEYATVIYRNSIASGGFLSISKPNSFEETKVKVDQGATWYNCTPAVELLEKMSNEGWEVYSTDVTATTSLVYNLKRKKK